MPHFHLHRHLAKTAYAYFSYGTTLRHIQTHIFIVLAHFIMSGADSSSDGNQALTSDERKQKEQIVLQILLHEIHENDDAHGDLIKLRHTFKPGCVRMDALCGGCTNYSFRAYVPGMRLDTQEYEIGDPVVFCKIGFDYAMWSPTKLFYPPERLDNEFHNIAVFEKLNQGCVGTPYACVQVDSATQVLITEYCTGFDEQYANQFIDGVVDIRPALGMATSLANLHALAAPDPTFNRGIIPTLEALGQPIRDFFARDFDAGDSTRFRRLRHEVDTMREHLEGMCNIFEKIHNRGPQVVVHSDAHAFNILVEPQSRDQVNGGNFGSSGGFRLIDWEMGLTGAIGADMGKYSAFPLACCLSHARMGHEKEANEMLDQLRSTWNTYLAKLQQHLLERQSYEETESFLLGTVESMIAYVAWFLILYVIIDCHWSNCPHREENNEVMNNDIEDAAAMLVMKLGKIAMTGDVRAHGRWDDLQALFFREAKEEIDGLWQLDQHGMPVKRRSSRLRASGTLVSDAHSYDLTVGSKK